MKIALLQINPAVGDRAGNAQLIVESAAAAKRAAELRPNQTDQDSGLDAATGV
jgi:predicted amidohydrolase